MITFSQSKRFVSLRHWFSRCPFLLIVPAAMAAERPNILFIAVDDLRPELGCYGSPAVRSPHLDALASRGLRFDRAYCQQAICHPSRSSLLTGSRPDAIGITHNYVGLRERNPDVLTLPQHFKNHGYETVFCGKIFHGKQTDQAHSWSRRPARNKLAHPKPSHYALPENRKIRQDNLARMIEKYGEAARQGLGGGPAFESADVPDHVYPDGYNTDLAIATLKEMAQDKEKPFFLALGFYKPHLNWNAPKRYWDLYAPQDITLTEQTTGPQDGAAVGRHASFELRTRHGIPKAGPLGDELSRTLTHAYYACVSYVDAQIGKMIAALKENGVEDNTVIIVWGDHGWHLGEMGIWGKATNYEIATRVPLIVSTPTMKSRGQGTNALVELIDLFPTLCELANLPAPGHLAGESFAPLLDEPSLKGKAGAISQFPSPALREWAANPLSPGMRETFFGPLIQEVESRIIEQQGETWDRDLFENHLMGYALRSDRHRLVVWRDPRKPDAEPVYVELYDHLNDPTETVNVAADHPTIVDALTHTLNNMLKP